MTMFPFNIMYPGADNLRQWIDTRWWSPNVSVNFAGNAPVEREVVEEVASYGKQIGWLADIVTALARQHGEQPFAAGSAAADSYRKLEDAQARIEEIKQRRTSSALDSARAALAKLATTDRTAYSHLVRTLDPNAPPAA
jgi:hypothetical protein